MKNESWSPSDLLQRVVRQYLAQFDMDSTVAGEISALAPEDKRKLVRGKLKLEIEKDKVKFFDNILSETTEAVVSAIEERLDLCSVCGETHGEKCYAHLESELSNVRMRRWGDGPCVAVRPRSFIGARDVMGVVSALLSGMLANGLRPSDLDDGALGRLFALAERVVKHGSEMAEKIDRDLNPSDYEIAT